MYLVTQLRRWLNGYGRSFFKLPDQVAEAKILAAKTLIHQIAACGDLPDIKEAEFKVFSQFGEDGILQYLIRKTGIGPELRTFVEFGVETYEEANTRFLLINDNWSGLIIDGSPASIARVRESSIYWRNGLTAIAAFIDADNINQLIGDNGFRGEIGLLSVDIDGNDYWVWDRIDIVNPVIVVAEYNSVFGADHAITVPYDPGFMRGRAHYSHLYWGASLKALSMVADRKGYALVGCNSAGNNAFFVRRDRLNSLKELTPEVAYVESKFKESRDANGQLTFLTGKQRLEGIRGMPVHDVLRGQVVTIAELAH
jgi:hypothetical protein